MTFWCVCLALWSDEELVSYVPLRAAGWAALAVYYPEGACDTKQWKGLIFPCIVSALCMLCRATDGCFITVCCVSCWWCSDSKTGFFVATCSANTAMHLMIFRIFYPPFVLLTVTRHKLFVTVLCLALRGRPWRVSRVHVCVMSDARGFSLPRPTLHLSCCISGKNMRHGDAHLKKMAACSSCFSYKEVNSSQNISHPSLFLVCCVLAWRRHTERNRKHWFALHAFFSLSRHRNRLCRNTRK